VKKVTFSIHFKRDLLLITSFLLHHKGVHHKSRFMNHDESKKGVS